MKCFLSSEGLHDFKLYRSIQTDLLGQIFLELFQFKIRSLFCDTQYENNDSCKQRLVNVLTLNTECNFSLFKKFLFFITIPLSSPFIINIPETVNCCNFHFLSTFVGNLGRELSCKRAARL